MTTKYDEIKNRYAPTGYEGQNYTENFTIPSCGIEDLDKAVFNLFDKQMPLYYDLKGEQKKVPVIFATGERYALLRRKKPIIDRTGALILPLVSISRDSISSKATHPANNQMFPHVIKKKISPKDIIYRQLNNFENLRNSSNSESKEEKEVDFSLKPNIKNNIIETIEIPPIKYYSATYNIILWASFTQQMNHFLEAVLNSFTINPGNILKIESDKGYWFTASIQDQISQQNSYEDYTDGERFVKNTLTLSTNGYIIAPNIKNGKTALRSFVSSPVINFEVLTDYTNIEPKSNGVQDSDPNANILDDLRTEDGFVPSMQIGIDSFENSNNLNNYDKSDAFSSNSQDEKYKSELVGERGTDYTKKVKKVFKDSSGNSVPVMVTTSTGQGETLYDSRFAEVLFNISNEE
jgi:hypothetical protein